MMKDCGVFSVVCLVCVQADEFAGSKVHFRVANHKCSISKFCKYRSTQDVCLSMVQSDGDEAIQNLNAFLL